MARLIWSPGAAEDLEAICAYIARDSELYAQEFARRIVQAVEVLKDFPEAGRIVPEFQDPKLRELVSGSYRTLYEIHGEEVRVLTIHHSARLLRERPGVPG